MKVTRSKDTQLAESLQHKISFRLVDDIRAKFNLKYPEVNEPPENEHPMAAVAIVLLSAIILDTTDIGNLAKFTGYTTSFISAIAVNMQRNKLWKNGRYNEEHWSMWLSRDWIIKDDNEFWEQIDVACGTTWEPGISTHSALDPCQIYWDERPLQRPAVSKYLIQ